MLPGAYFFRMRSLRTANSLTSRNMSLAPPARTLMPYHYSVASSPSQGTARPAFPFLQPVRHQPGLVPASSTAPLPWHPRALAERFRVFRLAGPRSLSDPRREVKTASGGPLKVSIMGKDMVLTDETKVGIPASTSPRASFMLLTLFFFLNSNASAPWYRRALVGTR